MARHPARRLSEGRTPLDLCTGRLHSGPGRDGAAELSREIFPGRRPARLPGQVRRRGNRTPAKPLPDRAWKWQTAASSDHGPFTRRVQASIVSVRPTPQEERARSWTDGRRARPARKGRRIRGGSARCAPVHFSPNCSVPVSVIKTHSFSMSCSVSGISSVYFPAALFNQAHTATGWFPPVGVRPRPE